MGYGFDCGSSFSYSGLITDIFGFLLLIPYTRNFIRKWIRHRIEKYVNSGYIIQDINAIA